MYIHKLASALLLSLIVLQPAQAWDDGKLFNTAILEAGISIINGETVFFLRISPSTPTNPWNPSEPCFFAQVLGLVFFTAGTESPSFAKQSMYLTALNAMSRGGRAAMEIGGCELPPDGAPPRPATIPLPELLNMSLGKVERIILIE